MAKVTSPDAAVLTTDDSIFGTPEYMAPERAQGEAVTPATDVYAMGLMAFEMLTGERPFDDDTPYKVMTRQVHDPMPPMPGVNSALQRVVGLALEKRPDRRPDARTFARLFREAVG